MADTKTLEQIKAELDAWIAKYIRQTVSFRTGQALNVDRFNELFNLLIQQGDDNINTMEVVVEYLNLMVTDYTRLIDEMTTNLNRTYAEMQAQNQALRTEVDGDIADLITQLNNTYAQMQANNVTLKSELTTQVNNLRDTLTATYAQIEDDNAALLTDITGQITAMNTRLTNTYSQIQTDNANLLSTLRGEIAAIDARVEGYQANTLALVQEQLNAMEGLATEVEDAKDYVVSLIAASEDVLGSASELFQQMDTINARLDNISATDYNITLTAANWVGSAAPYTYVLPYGNEYDVELLTTPSTTLAQVKVLEKAKIISNANANTVIAWGVKPTIDIPVTAKVKRKSV